MRSTWTRAELRSALRRLRHIDFVAVVLVVVALLLRVDWVMDARVAPIDDSAFYYRHAAELAAGAGYIHPETGAASAFLPPGYPLVLAAVFVVTGPSVLAVGWLNAVLAAAGLVFTYLLARSYFGRAAGQLAVAAMAFFPSQIIYTPAAMPDILFTTLVMGVLWAGLSRSSDSERPARARTLLCGAMLGAAVLTAPKAILLLPALLIAWHVRMSWAGAARHTALAGAAMLVVVLPWSVRSTTELRAPVFVSTNAGVNLWSGNHEGASGGWEPWESGTDGWIAPQDEAEVNSTYFARGMRYVLSNPLETLRLWPAKLDESFSQDFSYLGHFSLVPRDRPLEPALDNGVIEDRVATYYVAFMVLGLLGSIVVLLTRHEAGSLGWAAAALTLPIIVFFGLDRFHVPLLPLLAIAFGGGAVEAAQRARGALARATRAGRPQTEHLAPSAGSDESLGA